MTLRRDLSGLQSSTPTASGRRPDAAPAYGPELAAVWHDKISAEDERPHAVEGTLFRHSMAGMCARQVQYHATHEPHSNPPTIADAWRMFLGRLVHDHWQPVLRSLHPSAGVEVPVSLPDASSSGHIDLTLTNDDGTLDVLELKTINGFGFKRAIGARGEAEGPRSNAVRQGALNALAADARRLIIVYLSTELLSPHELRKAFGPNAPEWHRFCAEWTFDRPEWEPIAHAELARLARIRELTEAGRLAPRHHPDLLPGARITDPASGSWQLKVEGAVVDAGNTWVCDYCSWREKCIADGPG